MDTVMGRTAARSFTVSQLQKPQLDATEKLLVLRLIAASAAGVLLSMRKVSVILQALPRTRAASAFWLAGVLLLGLHAVQQGW
jgi:hypothetical protein